MAGMAIEVSFDHVSKRWGFKLIDREHDLTTFQSEYKYSSHHDAIEAGKDAIDFHLECSMQGVTVL